MASPDQTEEALIQQLTEEEDFLTKKLDSWHAQLNKLDSCSVKRSTIANTIKRKRGQSTNTNSAPLKRQKTCEVNPVLRRIVEKELQKAQQKKTPQPVSGGNVLQNPDSVQPQCAPVATNPIPTMDTSMNGTINNPTQFSHSHSSLYDNGGQSSSSSTQTASFPPPPTNTSMNANASNYPLTSPTDAIMNDKNCIVTSVNMPHMNGMQNGMNGTNGNGTNGILMNNAQNMQLQSMNGMSMGQMNGMSAMGMNGNGLAQMNANGINAMGMNGMSAMTHMNGNGLAMNQRNGMRMTQMNGYPHMNAQIITAANPMEQSAYNGVTTQNAQIRYNANMAQMNANGMNAQMNGNGMCGNRAQGYNYDYNGRSVYSMEHMDFVPKNPEIETRLFFL